MEQGFAKHHGVGAKLPIPLKIALFWLFFMGLFQIIPGEAKGQQGLGGGGYHPAIVFGLHNNSNGFPLIHLKLKHHLTAGPA